MFSSRFAKLVTDNKNAWKAGLAVVVAGATFKVTRTERWWGWLALLRSFSQISIKILYTVWFASILS
jgi:hypothetical protein